MRKTRDGEFKVPLQGRYEDTFAGDFEASYASIAGSGEWGVVSHQAVMDALSGFDLQRELGKRYFSKLGKLLTGRWR